MFMVLGEAQKNLAVINKRNFESSRTVTELKTQIKRRPDWMLLHSLFAAE
jgi:hypothetical protein